jgi:hypothetical protein
VQFVFDEMALKQDFPPSLIGFALLMIIPPLLHTQLSSPSDICVELWDNINDELERIWKVTVVE